MAFAILVLDETNKKLSGVFSGVTIELYFFDIKYKNRFFSVFSSLNTLQRHSLDTYLGPFDPPPIN